MPNSSLTIGNVTDEVQVNLGASGIDVELKDSDIRKGLIAALRVYNRSRPFVGNAKLAVNRTQRKYGPIDTLHPGFQGVRRISFVTQDTEPAPPGQIDPFNPNIISHADMPGSGCNRGDTYGQMQQRLMYLEDSARVASADNDAQGMWEHEYDSSADEWVDHFYIYAYVAETITIYCSYEWTGHYVLETPASVPSQGVLTLAQIPDGDVDWFMEFTLARCKQILARVRGKYEGIMNPEGATDSVDWSQLLDEGRESERDLREALDRRRRPLPPVVG